MHIILYLKKQPKVSTFMSYSSKMCSYWEKYKIFPVHKVLQCKLRRSCK